MYDFYYFFFYCIFINTFIKQQYNVNCQFIFIGTSLWDSFVCVKFKWYFSTQKTGWNIQQCLVFTTGGVSNKHWMFSVRTALLCLTNWMEKRREKIHSELPSVTKLCTISLFLFCSFVLSFLFPGFQAYAHITTAHQVCLAFWSAHIFLYACWSLTWSITRRLLFHHSWD